MYPQILLMVPTYSICSWLSFYSLRWAVYISVIRDCYEGFVVYNFFVLMLEYLGPDAEHRDRVLATKVRRRLPPPACLFTHDPRFRHFLSFCKLGILQYIFVRVSTTIAVLFMEIAQVYCPESMSLHFGHLYTTIFNSISVGLAMFTLFSLYLPIRHDIARFRPVGQFLSIKFVIFFQFWLGIIIKLLTSSGIIQSGDAWTVGEFSILLQSFATTVEMMIAAILHIWAFDYTGFRPTDGSMTPISVGLWDSLYWLDLWHDCVFIVHFLVGRLSRLWLIPSPITPDAPRLSGHLSDAGDSINSRSRAATDTDASDRDDQDEQDRLLRDDSSA
ncbi:organic solute transporter Ostalpha-domain-containing protein [Entophlyctis helioformis]|nr:organic solute transporter Ostalpha-domain-containing protein [Entophlyctis helioformis]